MSAAPTRYPIHELMTRRWSPRAFDVNKPVAAASLQRLMEAACWAPSCFGEEPWRYIVCDRFAHQAHWEQALSCLNPSNQIWAKNAPVLILACADPAFQKNGEHNRWAAYDTGAASENLCLQAVALDLAAHQMGGFNVDTARAAFAIPAHILCLAMIAVGHQAHPDTLDEPLKSRELAARSRKPTDDWVFAGAWAQPY